MSGQTNWCLTCSNCSEIIVDPSKSKSLSVYRAGGVGHGLKGIMGKKIKNGSFASDRCSVHISCYAIKIPGEIVSYGHYRSSSACKRYNMRCSFEIFLRKGGRNRRLLLASQNCYFLCRRDNFRDRNNTVRINSSFLHMLKVLDFERKLLFSALNFTSDFFQVH